MFSLEDFLFKRNKVVNNWALISAHCAPEIPFKINIICVFIVLRSNYCISFVSLSNILSRVVWTVMNGICILVPQANFADGGFAKFAPLPRSIFFIFILFFFIFIFFFWPGCGTIGTAVILLFVCCVLGRGQRKGIIEKKANEFLSEQITMMS